MMKIKHHVKTWIGVVGLFGAGFLPCPDCGTPMIIYFWPLALLLSFRNYIRIRKSQLIAEANEMEER